MGKTRLCLGKHACKACNLLKIKDFLGACQGGKDATKKDSMKGIPLKMPSKDNDIRSFFDYSHKKCILWTNYYDLSDNKLFVKVNTYTDVFENILPQDKRDSFMRGLFSACGNVNLKNNIVSAPLQLFFTRKNDNGYLDNGKVGTSYEHNAERVYISDKEKLEYFYKNIGFIQKSQEEETSSSG